MSKSIEEILKESKELLDICEADLPRLQEIAKKGRKRIEEAGDDAYDENGNLKEEYWY